jgi:hypothetical protein
MRSNIKKLITFINQYWFIKVIMLSDVEIETQRLLFIIERDILTMELKNSIDKTMELEKIIQSMSIFTEDDVVYPPRKKLRVN